MSTRISYLGMPTAEQIAARELAKRQREEDAREFAIRMQQEVEQIRAMSDEELRAKLWPKLRGREKTNWKWIEYCGRRITKPVFRADGTAAADGESERVALEALVFAYWRDHVARSESAKQAAITRKRRQEIGLQKLVKEWLATGKLQPSKSCRHCGRGLCDANSLARGIGSECWGVFLAAVEKAQSSRAKAPAVSQSDFDFLQQIAEVAK